MTKDIEKCMETFTFPESVTVNLSNLPKPKLPNWSGGRALIDVIEPVSLSIGKLTNACTLEQQTPSAAFTPTGHDMLALLVKSYKVAEVKKGNACRADLDDPINMHFGLKELLWLEQNWQFLPEASRDQVSGKRLWGHRDVLFLFDKESEYDPSFITCRVGTQLFSPCLDCRFSFTPIPCVVWCNLSETLDYYKPGIHE